MGQEEILLKEYEICEQDNAGNFQGYWTLAGIFIGVSSALLAGLIYGVISNSSLFKVILFHNNLKISLVVGIIAIMIAIANVIILQKLRSWHKRILYNQSNNTRRMREIELQLGDMRREWRIYAVKRWCDEFGDKRSHDSDEEIWQKIRPILMGSVDDSLINEISKIQKTIINEIRHFYVDKITGNYEPTSSKKHYPCILSVIQSIWVLVILASVILIASFFPGWQWGLGAIGVILVVFILYYSVKKSSDNEIDHTNREQILFKPLPWGTLFFSFWVTLRVVDSPETLMKILTCVFLVISGILLVLVFVQLLFPNFQRTLTQRFPRASRTINGHNLSNIFIPIVFFTSLLAFPTNIIMKWSKLQEIDVFISVVGLVAWMIAYILILISIASRQGRVGRILSGIISVLIIWRAIDAFSTNPTAGWILIIVAFISIIIMIIRPKSWNIWQIV